MLETIGRLNLRTKAITSLTFLRWCGLPSSSDNRSTDLPQDSAHSETNPVGNYKANPSYILVPKSAVDYAWDYPAAREKKILLVINGWRRPVDILEIGNLMPFKFSVCLEQGLQRTPSHSPFCRIVLGRGQSLWMFGLTAKLKF